MKRLLVMLVSVGVLVAPLGPVAAEPRPARSGSIVGGTGLELTGGQPYEQSALERSGCEYAADCSAWLRSGCRPAMAGLDPALTASIVDVAGLAGRAAPRTLRMTAPSVPPWGLWPGAVIQLWREDCTEISRAKQHSIGAGSTCTGPDEVVCSVRIPVGAKWMTLSGYVTTAHLTWTLT